VWEANHVWLVLLLVVCWTGFGEAFASIMTTLFVPLTFAALGVVLRGANFAMRKEARLVRRRYLAGWMFGIGSLITPFFLGASVGALLAARVPAGDAGGDEITSWWNPTAVLVGLLAVALGAFQAAVYLVAEAEHRADPALRAYFRVRAASTGLASLVLGVTALVALRADEREMFDRLTSRGVVLLALGAVGVGVVAVLAVRGVVRRMRLVAALAIGCLVWAWGVAQYPYLLPFDLRIDAGAGAAVTMRWILVWFVVALLVVVPALVLLYVLDQRGELAEPEEGTASAPDDQAPLPSRPRR
jgi:cytochrome bd ubiquinol oxidase subunit II